jgi:hypothetical protein
MKFSILAHTPNRPTRPQLTDLGVISDPVVQRLALVELNRILDSGQVSAYMPAAADWWNLWLGKELAPPHGRRVKLEEWVQQFAAQHASGRPGGAA